MEDPAPQVRSTVRALVRASGPFGLGLRASGIDELADEVVEVCNRVENIHRIADAAGPTLKRLAVALDGIEEQIQPIGALACRIPRSRAKRRRRAANLAAMEGALAITADAADPDRSTAEVRQTAEAAATRIDTATPRALDDRPRDHKGMETPT
ncbi:unannotated protein [freshwater metagenome]|uniref:Unannotated protein n=1 Tax=freshwater metagenome TaxID=449393 RepID=A0A6J7HTF2_9ZZZZ|nr:hypothetical protein [Actinomycetota bacterium]